MEYDSRLNMPTRNDVQNLVKNNWRLIASVVAPIVLLPVWLVPGTDPAKCAYVICLMGVFWYEFGLLTKGFVSVEKQRGKLSWCNNKQL